MLSTYFVFKAPAHGGKHFSLFTSRLCAQLNVTERGSNSHQRAAAAAVAFVYLTPTKSTKVQCGNLMSFIPCRPHAAGTDHWHASVNVKQLWANALTWEGQHVRPAGRHGTWKAGNVWFYDCAHDAVAQTSNSLHCISVAGGGQWGIGLADLHWHMLPLFYGSHLWCL